MALKNGPKAAELPGRQTEEILFLFFFNFLRGEHVPNGSEDCLAS